MWFKRDLRVYDNKALFRASKFGPVLPLFVVEKEFWYLPDSSARQWAFVSECLSDLRKNLAQIGQPLIVREGDVISVFNSLLQSFEITSIYSHEETGNRWTYKRDRRVASWCKANGIEWFEIQQNGVQRKIKSRVGWAKAWDQHMVKACTVAPAISPLSGIDLGRIPSVQDLGLSYDGHCVDRQKGGRRRAEELLQSFLTERGEYYRKEMSNPLNGARACSRLSPHLAWGSISVREVSHAVQARNEQLLSSASKGRWNGTISSFKGRLYWHCHFMQKLEDNSLLEFENMHSLYNGVRPSVPDETKLSAWTNGETGLPFVDACMRSLKATGWLNFRMRAMLIATASYHLWLHWRQPGEHLARMFTDYEPGIHWPQVQMQSGTTGINTIRIYNPIKQGYDQDPNGLFTRRWLPELSGIEDRHLQQPWKSKNASKILDKSYPFPIVDPLEAAKEARQKMWSIRTLDGFKGEAQSIQKKHGSRRSGIKMRGNYNRNSVSSQQLNLDFNSS